MSGPAAASPFPADALEANRAGRLTDAQRKTWADVDRRWGGNVALIALVLGLGGVALLAGPGQTPLPTPLRLLAGVACLAGAGVLVYVSLLGGGQLTRDLRDGTVESAEGAISKEHDPLPTDAGPNPERCYLDVASKRLACGRTEFDAAPDAGIVRVYFLPRSRRLINLERLADRPLPAGALDGPDAAIAAVAPGLASHDRTQRAEAMATVAAMQDSLTAPATPPADGRDARPLAQAIVGAWHGRMGSVTFGADGSATGSLGGTQMASRWSVGGDGKRHLDGMGEEMVVDARVAGDALTLVLDGMSMPFQRATAA